MKPPNNSRGCFFQSMICWPYQDFVTPKSCHFKSLTILLQNVATLCEGDLVGLWISSVAVIKMIVESTCDVHHARNFATGFKITLIVFAGSIGTVMLIMSSKLIAVSFREITAFASLIGF